MVVTMRFKHCILVVLLIFFSLVKSLNNISYALEPFPRKGEVAGRTTVVRGQANIIFVNEVLPRGLVKGQELISDDTIITQKGGRVAIILADNTQFKINENSRVAIKQVKDKNEEKKRKEE